MPTDDTSIPCADIHARNPIQTTQAQQAAYAVQAFALAAAVGYGRIGFYQMVDDNPCIQSAVWGITRDDGTRSPGRSHAAHRGPHFLGLFPRPVRATGPVTGALVGLAARSDVVHPQLADL